MRRKYAIQRAESSFCPTCEHSVDLLCDVKVSERMPMFYICWYCRAVRHIGVGLVERESA